MIKVNGEVVKIEHYPDGTQRINIPDITKRKYMIDWRYEREEELSAIIYITKSIQDLEGYIDCELKIPYLPNARMDRIHSKKEVFTLKAFADVINWLGFKRVHILDVHSNVGAALIDRAILYTPERLIEDTIEDIGDGELILYFPDEGAAKRYANMFPEKKFCYGEKVRDWETGQIQGLYVVSNGIDLKGKTVLMVDDIISYGGSLYYSANKLKTLDVGKIYAYATHTENSILDQEKGKLIKLLEDGTVEKLFTTDSIFNERHEKIMVRGVLG